MKKRDLTEVQFRAQLAKRGWSEASFMGYIVIQEEPSRVMVSRLNAGSNRRNQLRYLDREAKKLVAPLPPHGGTP